MPYYLTLALDNGVKPREISEIITHLAFYSGWPNAMSAVAVAKDVFAQRKIGSDQLPPASPQLLPLDEAAEAQRASRVGEQFGSVAPGVVQYTTDVLFRDLWLRPDLAPRDRSLVTVSALIASGQVAQLPSPPQRAMDNGLTQAQAAEALDAPGLLRRLAQRLLGAPGRKGCLREASQMRPDMKLFLAGVMSLSLLASASDSSQAITITRTARNRRVKAPPRPSPGPYASILCSTPTLRHARPAGA